MALFFIIQMRSKEKRRHGIFLELFVALVASIFLGFGTFFATLTMGLYP
jgi:hypothetical protein